MAGDTNIWGSPCYVPPIHLGSSWHQGPQVAPVHLRLFPQLAPNTARTLPRSTGRAHSSLTPPTRSARIFTRTHTAPRGPKAVHSAHMSSRFCTHARPNATGHRVPCMTAATTPHSTPQFAPTRRPIPGLPLEPRCPRSGAEPSHMPGLQVLRAASPRGPARVPTRAPVRPAPQPSARVPPSLPRLASPRLTGGSLARSLPIWEGGRGAGGGGEGREAGAGRGGGG